MLLKKGVNRQFGLEHKKKGSARSLSSLWDGTYPFKRGIGNRDLN